MHCQHKQKRDTTILSRAFVLGCSAWEVGSYSVSGIFFRLIAFCSDVLYMPLVNVSITELVREK